MLAIAPGSPSIVSLANPRRRLSRISPSSISYRSCRKSRYSRLPAFPPGAPLPSPSGVAPAPRSSTSVSTDQPYIRPTASRSFARGTVGGDDRCFDRGACRHWVDNAVSSLARRTRPHWPRSPQPASIFPRRSQLPNNTVPQSGQRWTAARWCEARLARGGRQRGLAEGNLGRAAGKAKPPAQGVCPRQEMKTTFVRWNVARRVPVSTMPR